MAPRLIIFDDARARAWQPFTLTRPAAELLLGGTSLAARIERALGLECAGHLTSPHLSDFQEGGARPVIEPHEPSEPTLFWCARAVPEPGTRVPLADPGGAYSMGGAVVAYMAPPGSEPPADFLNELVPPHDVDPVTEVEGRLVERVWELLELTPSWLALELAELEDERSRLPAGTHAIGDHPLSLAADVRIEPGCVFDLREGPVQIEAAVEIRAGTRLAGPSLIGAHSRLLGGSLESVVAGPYSYLRGEVASSVILGYTNKVHDGYLGHAYVGRWVNLGAGTTNSDLKNNYHTVRVWTPSGIVDTGLVKLGCFLGDHAKTGIGTLLGTGTVIGAGANVYGSRMPPRYVPPFSWGEGEDLGEYRLDAFVDTARRAMERRGVELSDRGRRYLESCWRKGRGG